jgi:TonB-linked SusC/RagA family outer membrane protein
MKKLSLRVAIFLAAALLPASLSAQEAATISGRVTNAQGQPEAAVLVRVNGMNVGSTTDAEGRYQVVVPGSRIRDGQSVEMVASRQGLGTISRSITLRPGASLTQNFTMAAAAILLEGVVVTGVSGATEQAKLPITVAQITADDMPVAASSAAGMIQGKVTGATVVAGSGRPGSPPSIMLRAPTMINGVGRSQEPMYIVDGVILAESTVDIDALDIESVEIVKGAAAASMYGSRASNGVIQIRTRSGRDAADNSIRYTLRTEYGQSELANRINVAQYHPWKLNQAGTKFVTAGGVEFDWGQRNPTTGAFYTPTLAGTNIWNTVQVHRWPGGTFDHVERVFQPGQYSQSGITAEGRQGRTNFLASVSNLSDEGVIWNQTGNARQSFRLNLDQAVLPDVHVSTRSYYSRATAGLFPEVGGSPLFNLTRMPAGVNLERRDTITGELVISPDVNNTDNDNPLEFLSKREQSEDRERFLGSVNVRFTPVTWAELAGDVSYDRSRVNRSDFAPVGYQTGRADATLNNGYVFKDGVSNEALNASLTSTFRRQFGDLASTTQLRYLYEASDYDLTRASAYNLVVGGLPHLDAAKEGHITRSANEEVRSEGIYGSMNLDFRDRYILDGLVRRDGSSLFGSGERWQTYYRAAGAWRVSEEPFFSGLTHVVDEFKLRYSVGTAGGRPNFYAQYETYDVTDGIVAPVALGNTDLKPEFVIEQEAGIDMSLFGRVDISAVYARTEARDQILRVPLPAASGFLQQWKNAGTLNSNTLELSLDARVVDSGMFSWNAALGVDRTRQKITRLNVPQYQAGFPLRQGLEGVFFVREGEELGAIYGTKFATSCADLPSTVDCSLFDVNDDGYFVYVGPNGSYRDAGWSPTFATLGDNRAYFWGTPVAAMDDQGNSYMKIGSTQPNYNWHLSNTLRFGGLSLYTLLDATRGVSVYNLPRHWATFQRYSEIVDQAGKAPEAQKPVGYYAALYRGLTPNSAFVEDGSFVKLREVSLRYRFGDQLLNRVPLLNHTRGFSVNLTGRNLFTWTNYTGYDPEVGITGGDVGSATISRFDGFNYPQMRTLTLGAELSF